jgi:hypothetical protein
MIYGSERVQLIDGDNIYDNIFFVWVFLLQIVATFLIISMLYLSCKKEKESRCVTSSSSIPVSLNHLGGSARLVLSSGSGLGRGEGGFNE